MRTFEFTNRLRITLLVGIAIGLICLGLTWFSASDDGFHSRFWSNVLHNSAFFTMISALAAFFLAASVTAWAGWYTVFKRVWESMGLFLLFGLIMMGLIGLSVYMGWNELYHWNDATSVENDQILDGKKGFLNKGWYFFGTLVIVGAWYFFATRFRALSLQEEREGNGNDFQLHRRLRFFAAAYLPVFGFTMCAMVWLWIMSVDAHWYSTLFAWYTGASAFVSMICLTILILNYLRNRGYYQNVTTEHMHDLGKLLFAFSIFWTYLWFSQYMLIWYANVGEETGYFHTRINEYPILFYGNLIINFLVPFFVLMRNDTKRKMGSLTFVAAIVLLGHWVDYFQMIKPGVAHTAHEIAVQEAGGHHGAETKQLGAHDHGHDAHGHDKGSHDHGNDSHGHDAHGHDGHGHGHGSFNVGFSIPGFLEIGTFLGYLSLFLFFVFTSLSRSSLTSEHDPFIEESLHHHV